MQTFIQLITAVIVLSIVPVFAGSPLPTLLVSKLSIRGTGTRRARDNPG